MHSSIFRHLRNTGEHSDLVIECGSSKYEVHKCVVCPQSGWFATACEKGKWKEAIEATITLAPTTQDLEDEGDYSCDLPEAVGLMIDYLYLEDYVPGSKAVDDEVPGESDVQLGVREETEETPPQPMMPSPQVVEFPFASKKKKKTRMIPGIPSPEPVYNGALCLHARLYAMASKYDIKPFRTTVIEKLSESLAGAYNWKDFAEAIVIVFRNTPDDYEGLRNIFIKTLLDATPALILDPVIEKAVTSIEGLPYLLFKQKTLQDY